ncbi:MAG: hypothetical protein DRP00_05570, partial [Candidatus Aenigmatarchaeota archaeon]
MIYGNNIANSSYDGIYLWQSSSNMIYGNNIANSSWGIYLCFEDSSNMIYGNNIANSSWGIYLELSDGNYVFLNNFVGNVRHVYIVRSVNNVWSSPNPLNYAYNNVSFTGYMGNYWDNYTGSDSDGDGIGDTPHQIDPENVDNYPLIEPAENYFVSWISIDVEPPVIGEPILSPAKPVENVNITVSVEVSDAYSGVKNVTLCYRVDSGVWNMVEMFLENGVWKAQIPAQPTGTTVEYYIEAYDNAENKAATKTYTYIVASAVVAKILNFTVYHEGAYYNLSLRVLSSSYEDVLQRIDDIKELYPDVEETLLASAYYLKCYIENPENYPIYNVSLMQNGQLILDSQIKKEVLNKLLIYCYVLFGAAWPEMLSSYQMFGQEWLEAYENSAWTVKVSDTVTEIAYILTVLGPILDAIKASYSAEASRQVEDAISLFFNLISYPDKLREIYGDAAASSTIDILIEYGLIQSENYNPANLYRKFVSDPSLTLQVIKEIELEVFGIEMNTDAQNIFKDLIANLEKGFIADFAVGAALSSLAYFYYGLTAKTAVLIGVSKVLENFLGGTLPLSLANVILGSYVMPMAQALHAAWIDQGLLAKTYFNMYDFAYQVAHPLGNVFNLTCSDVFAGLYGTLCLLEFHYYMNLYFYRSRQLFVSESELEGLKSSAQTAFSHAEDWAGVLENISSYAEAIVNLSDPEGTIFNFTFGEPLNLLPVVPENSSGFILASNFTSRISMRCGSQVFLVEDGKWFSNFTYATFI